MKVKTKFKYDSFRGQCVMLLLGALHELGGRSRRREVLGYIAERNYFEMAPEDRLPFPTAIQPEARWELLMGDVVPACVQGGGILETEEGSWELTAEGADLYSQTVDRFRDGTFDAHRCFLWTAHFKRRLVPDYERWPEDRQRPADLYHDVLWHLSALAAA